MNSCHYWAYDINCLNGTNHIVCCDNSCQFADTDCKPLRFYQNHGQMILFSVFSGMSIFATFYFIFLMFRVRKLEK